MFQTKDDDADCCLSVMAARALLAGNVAARASSSTSATTQPRYDKLLLAGGSPFAAAAGDDDFLRLAGDERRAGELLELAARDLRRLRRRLPLGTGAHAAPALSNSSPRSARDGIGGRRGGGRRSEGSRGRATDECPTQLRLPRYPWSNPRSRSIRAGAKQQAKNHHIAITCPAACSWRHPRSEK